MQCIFTGQVIGKGTHIRWTEVEATAHARVNNESHRALHQLHVLDRLLDAAPALVLFLFADEDERRDFQFVRLFRITIDLHRLGGVRVLHVRVPGNITGDVLLLTFECHRYLKRVIAAPRLRGEACLFRADIWKSEQRVHTLAHICFQFVIVLDGHRWDEMRLVDIRGQYDEAARGEAFHLHLDKIVQSAPAMHVEHRWKFSLATRAGDQRRYFGVATLVGNPAGFDLVIGGRWYLSLFPPGVVPPPGGIGRRGGRFGFVVGGHCRHEEQGGEQKQESSLSVQHEYSPKESIAGRSSLTDAWGLSRFS